MAGIMKTITNVLMAAGYRAGDASPGRIMPEVTEPVIAVNLEHLDTQKLTMTVCATVVSPLALGARTCEDEALKVCRILQDVGAECTLEPCQLNAKTEVFFVPVMAKFQGNILNDSWSAGRMCRVKFGSTNLQRIVSFSAWRETDEEAATLRAAVWKFRVEERMEGIMPETEPAEPFTMTVTFEDEKEIYAECALTYQKRTIADGFLLQIREGTAKTRTLAE